MSRVADRLKKGFGRQRTLRYWQQALARLAQHPSPQEMPKYGYLMEREGVPIGIILLIHSRVRTDHGWTVRCNLSSWYVEPAFRSHAPLLVAQALKRRDVTYLNMSAAPHTRPIIEAQGFTRYSNGQFVSLALPALLTRTTERLIGAETLPDAPFETFERDLLLDHVRYGCVGVWCATAERAYPFVFAPRRLKGFIPSVQLIYCRHTEDYARFARPIGAYLAARGKRLVLVDAAGPIRGLPGCYVDGLAPRYFRGPAFPRLGDLAYSEAALFGM
ncbi:MAG: hypothetical protein ABSG76_07315 [Xanthobacteraceae bacterium]